ncbi:MAG: glutathione S-transferase family protein [Parvibaculaceae bacterium]
MAKLIHFPLDPFSRRIRVSLGEYGEEAELNEERPWEGRETFLALSPSGTLPVFIDNDGSIASGIEAVSEYLDDTRGSRERTLIGSSAAERAEARRLIAWFDTLFFHEVSQPLLSEKVVRRFLPKERGGGAPEMPLVRSALGAIRRHLDYIAMLAEARNWLAGDRLTGADLAAAAHISVIDYLGDMPWGDNPRAKAWYQRIKSRPTFRSLLADRISGMPPSRVYADLDF